MNQKGSIYWIALLIILTVGLVFIYIKSANSLPGDLIYPIKEIRESLSLALYDLSFEGRAATYINFTNNRFEELLKLIEQGRSETDIKESLERLTTAQQKALLSIDRAKNHGTVVTKHVEELEIILKNQYEVLLELYYRVPPSLYENMSNTRYITAENLQKVRQLKTK